MSNRSKREREKEGESEKKPEVKVNKTRIVSLQLDNRIVDFWTKTFSDFLSYAHFYYSLENVFLWGYKNKEREREKRENNG